MLALFCRTPLTPPQLHLEGRISTSYHKEDDMYASLHGLLSRMISTEEGDVLLLRGWRFWGSCAERGFMVGAVD